MFPRLPLRHIGVVTTSFPRHESDYAGSFVLEYVEALRRAGHSVEVVAPQVPGDVCPSWCKAQSLTQLRVGADALNPFYESGVADNLQRRPLAAMGLASFGQALRRELSSRRWQVQINHWVFPYGFFRSPNVKQIGVFHSADLFALERMPGRKHWARALVRSLDGVHFVTQGQRERLSCLLPSKDRIALSERSTVCPMPVRVPENACSRQAIRSQLQLANPTALVLGRLVDIKGVDRAIRLLSQMEALHLVVAGTGPAKKRLKRLARAFGERIRFTGELSREQKWSWLRGADVLLVPSRTTVFGRREGMPTVIAEARAVGCPVVTTVEAARETYGHDPCLHIVNRGSVDGLVHAVEKALSLGRQAVQPHLMGDLVERHLRWTT